MIGDDLAAVRLNLARLYDGAITPEFFDQVYDVGGIEQLLEELQAGLEEFIRELFAAAVLAQGEDADANEEAIQQMLRELGTVAYVAGRLRAGDSAGLTVEISPDAAVEVVRSLLAGQRFGFSFAVKESME